MFEFMMSKNIKLNPIYSKEEYKAQADILWNEINKMLVDEIEFRFVTQFSADAYCVVKTTKQGYYLQINPIGPEGFKDTNYYQEWRYKTYVEIYLWMKEQANNYNKHFNALFNKIKLDPIPDKTQAGNIDIPVEKSVGMFVNSTGDAVLNDDTKVVQSFFDGLSNQALTITSMPGPDGTIGINRNHPMDSYLTSGSSGSSSTITNSLENKIDQLLDVLIAAKTPDNKKETINEVKQPVEYRRPVSINRNQDRVSKMIQSFRRNRMTK